ncbi:hypothetical protein EDB85DRAFT_1891791 [Lactarius pseudohatsudake]|nr:hypothetical protein EDB85DRAFT_1891791 [Lactarius pseudohatsudake]
MAPGLVCGGVALLRCVACVLCWGDVAGVARHVVGGTTCRRLGLWHGVMAGWQWWEWWKLAPRWGWCVVGWSGGAQWGGDGVEMGHGAVCVVCWGDMAGMGEHLGSGT